MYVPPAFQGPEQEQLFDFIEAHSFGLLVSQVAGEPFATHLPLLLARDVAPHGRLIGHLARANPHWQNLVGQPVLAVFSGPHAYISPTWYEAESVVPTWNYVAVHATGHCELVEDEAATSQVLTDYVAFYERSMPRPWTIDMGTDFASRLARQVVAFRVDVEKLEGKWKLGQNHAVERREKVARHLASSESPDAQEIARLMRETIEKAPGL